ncbi:hypothetical protein PR048_018683 [Dryococelus australis]|uniref:HTH psq-type domain-containing protein n=1 Tax=Dryococelus australis TaxID=614101 RepID=A0ABQ9HCX3_9NEOP|nr:hypothetical protein PR048_018683 [Dryococelus australis]
MVCTYKRTGAYFKWTNKQLNSATQAVVECSLSVRAAAAHFDIPYETLRRTVSTDRLQRSYVEHHMQDSLPTKKTISHPTLLIDEQENDLVSRQISLSNRGLGCDSEGVRHAVYRYVDVNSIKHPWGKFGIAGKDWLHSFMKSHPNRALRKPEGLS